MYIRSLLLPQKLISCTSVGSSYAVSSADNRWHIWMPLRRRGKQSECRGKKIGRRGEKLAGENSEYTPIKSRGLATISWHK